MKKQKIKIYRMPLSRVFPATHPRAGEQTHFAQFVINGQGCLMCSGKNNIIICMDLNCIDPSIRRKLHTIRSDEKGLWKRRIQEVQQGNAVLVVYQWNGKPYSKDGNTNLFVFGTSAAKGFIDELTTTERYRSAFPVIDSGIGTQELKIIPVHPTDFGGNDIEGSFPLWLDVSAGGRSLPDKDLAVADGLSVDDFREWFNGCDLSKPMTIIHFTSYRY
jgi:hypothetical protein